MAQKHDISLQEAVKMTSLYRVEKDVILKPGVSKDVLPLCETFDKAAFEELYKVPGCVAIRCYLGMDANKDIRLIFVASNAANEDILPADGGVIKEVGQRCPPICPGASPLNQ